MNLNRYNFKNFSSVAAGLAIMTVFLFSGCFINFSKYGQYQSSQKVARMFEDDKLPANYSYYYANTFSQPDALIGIEPGYTLDNNLWTRVNLTPAILQQLEDNLTRLPGYSVQLLGSYIVGPKGEVIGIYYSKWRGGPIAMESDNKVSVNLPEVREEELPKINE